MSRLEMKEGNTGPCWKCGKQLFVRMTKGSDKYPAKLQRQEHIEGTNPPEYQSHYQFNKETNETSCRGVLPLQTDENQQKIENVGVSKYNSIPDTVYPVKELDVNDLTVKAFQKHFDSDTTDFDMYEAMTWKKYGKNINPAKVGLIIKFLEERRKERANGE